MNEVRDLAVGVARAAGELLARAVREGARGVTSKSTLIDLVTDADRDSERLVLDAVRERFPEHAVLAEESGAGRTGGPYRWVIDPLDGTVNFAHGLPHFAVLIAVQERSGSDYETVVGVTYDPVRDELFLAARGQGATLNGVPIRVSKVGRLIDATAVTGFAYDRLFRNDDNHREFCRMNLVTQGVRRLGSAGLDLAYVAAGRLDLFWESGLSPWDLAAGALLVAEAGGQVTSISGGTVDLAAGDVIASNGVLHDATRRVLEEARDLPIGSRDGLEAHLPADLVAKLRDHA
jgi:myo-inositol-1(or 4)-monophosphatase